MPALLAADDLNSVKYLYLRELEEPRDNSLRIVVQEAVTIDTAAAGSGSETREFEAPASEYRPIESTKDCRSFELSWEHYVAYLVTEEMAGSCGSDDDGSFSGKLFRLYSKSHLLEYLGRATGGHTRPLQHYKVICLNHLVDVAAYEPPQIRTLKPGSKHLRVQ